ncbi:MAG: peptidylprolyl isomerase [Firmicutes bacterium]|nr:peptidylprolyl isomerase [Bacillota bacterium]
MVFSSMRKHMKWIIVFVALTFAVTLVYVGAQLPSSNGRAATSVATVNGTPISQNEFLDNLQQALVYQENVYGPVRPTQMTAFKSQILDQMITSLVVIQAAQRNHIRVSGAELDKAYQDFAKSFSDPAQLQQFLATRNLTKSRVRDLLKQKLMAEKMLEQVKGQAKVSDAEVARAYEQVQARHILIAIPKGPDGDKTAKAEAEKLVQQLRSGADFAALAKQYSADPGTKDKGGELGYFGRGQMDPAFEKVAFSLPVKAISDPVKTRFGYHIIQVEARKEAKGPEFDKAKAQLRQQLLQTKQNEILQNWLQEEERKAKISIEDPQLAAFRDFAQGKYDQAIQLYQQALKDRGQDAYVLSDLAQAYQRKGDIAQAIKYMQEAAKLADGDPILQLSLGDLYQAQKQDAKAVAAYEKASQLDARDFYLHLTLATRFQALKRPDLAQKEQDRVAAIQKEYQDQLAQQEKAAQQNAAPQNPPSQNAGRSTGQKAGAQTSGSGQPAPASSQPAPSRP